MNKVDLYFCCYSYFLHFVCGLISHTVVYILSPYHPTENMIFYISCHVFYTLITFFLAALFRWKWFWKK